MLRRENTSFGPVVRQMDGSPDMDARCYSGTLRCVFLAGNTCTHVKPSRAVEDLPACPDWCEMKAGMLADAAEMAGTAKEPR